jgi:DNA-binding SARP family transcriptional activator/tetratricopeptide (TPR) repeat protein
MQNGGKYAKVKRVPPQPSSLQDENVGDAYSTWNPVSIIIKMNHVHVRLLGECVITAGGEPIATLSKPRLQSLLVYLIMHRDAPQFRRHLAGVLWPDSSPAQAYTNLRNLVYLLCRALPDGDRLICADFETLQWNPEVSIDLDVDDFRHIAEQIPLQDLPLDQLEAAARIYQGDLLPSCYDAWIEADREHYRQLFAALLDQLVDRYEGLRRYPQAITACQRLVATEPFHRLGYTRLARLQVLNEEPQAALKTCQKYARLLKRELGLELPAEMQALCDHARRAARQGRAKTASAPALSPGGQLPLVGRIAEWRAILEYWKTTAAGQPRMLFIQGEAGIGKTRLAEELLDWASRQGIRSIAAHCYASEGALPYTPVVAWLRTLHLPPLEPVWLVELSRLLPELLKRKAKPPPPLSEDWQRLRLFEALARAILGGRKKTLLLIEDLHWCDQDTLEWLHYLLRFDPSAPLLVVGTARSEEIAASPALEKLLSSLRQEVRTLEIELSRLSEEETGQLAAYVAGKVLARGFGALIYQETEGNPLFIVETLRAELFKKKRSPGVQPLPYKTQAVLENRILQLSPSASDLCLLAATIGRSFSLEVLRRACTCPETEVVEGLEELLRRRIVREIGHNTFDFNHDKLRDAAFTRVSNLRVQILHRQVADALVSLAAKDPENWSGEIAHHYEQAGSAGLAIRYYRMAGENARKTFANQPALQFYQRAIALCEAGEAGSSGLDIAADLPGLLNEELGDVLALVGKFEQAQAAFERALSRPAPVEAIWRAEIYRKISAVLIQKYQRPQALGALDHAERALGLSPGEGLLPERQEWLQIQLARSNVFYWNNQPEEMDAIHRQILPLVEADGRPDQQLELLGQQLMARFRHERYRLSAETVDIARRRLALVSTLDNPYNTAWAQFNMGFSLLWHSDPRAARDWMIQSYEEAARMGASLLQVRSLAYLSVASRQLGDVQSAREESLRLYEQAESIGEYSYQGISLANQGWLAWREGDPDRAEQLCTAAKEIWRNKGWGMFAWLADWVLLAIAVSQRNPALAEERAQTLLHLDPDAQPLLDEVEKNLVAARQACYAGQVEAAFQDFNQVLELVKNSGDL